MIKLLIIQYRGQATVCSNKTVIKIKLITVDIVNPKKCLLMHKNLRL